MIGTEIVNIIVVIFDQHINKLLENKNTSKIQPVTNYVLQITFKVFNREEKLDWSACTSAKRKKWPGFFLDFYIVPLRYSSPCSPGYSLYSVIRVNASLKNGVIITPSTGNVPLEQGGPSLLKNRRSLSLYWPLEELDFSIVVFSPFFTIH